jgi:hypothetical protein
MIPSSAAPSTVSGRDLVQAASVIHRVDGDDEHGARERWHQRPGAQPGDAGCRWARGRREQLAGVRAPVTGGDQVGREVGEDAVEERRSGRQRLERVGWAVVAHGQDDGDHQRGTDQRDRVAQDARALLQPEHERHREHPRRTTPVQHGGGHAAAAVFARSPSRSR